MRHGVRRGNGRAVGSGGSAGDVAESTAIQPHMAAPLFHADTATEEEFLAKLKELGEDWRWSDDFIGLVVRMRYPKQYDFKGEE